MSTRGTVSKACLFLAVVLLSTSGCRPRAGVEVKGTDRLFSFAVITDVHSSDQPPHLNPPHTSRYYRQSLRNLDACVEDLNGRDLAFAIQLGDFVDEKREYLDLGLPVYNRLRTARYHVLGNHDYRRYNAVDRQEMVDALGMKSAYYDFAVRGYRFVVLNGDDPSRTSKAQVWPGVSAQQKAWLRERLSEARQENERVVVFCHYPVYPANWHNMADSDETVKILGSSGCVVAYFSGHYHRGNYGQENGVHYITLQAMVEAKEKNAYAVVDVFGDRLEVHGVGTVPSRQFMLQGDESETEPVP